MSLSSLSSDDEADVVGPPPSEEVAPPVTTFRFHTPLLDGPLVLAQPGAAGSIGFKLYPAALLMAGLLEGVAAGVVDAPVAALGAVCGGLSGKVVVELGAGVCGLPAQITNRLGATVFATDMPALIPELRRNLESNAGVGGVGGGVPRGGLHTEPLLWGTEEPGVEALAATVAATCGGRVGCDLILAADVVYHEHLIQPLIDCFLQLTNPWPAVGGGGGDWVPPPIALTYVQRFKRSKRFFKLLRKQFTVEHHPLEPVVDYDVLNFGWDLPDGMLDVDSRFANRSQFSKTLAGGEAPRRAVVDDDVPYCGAALYIIRRKPPR